MSPAVLTPTLILCALLLVWIVLCVRTWQIFLGSAYMSVVDARRPVMAVRGERHTIAGSDGAPLSYWWRDGQLPIAVVLSWGYRCRIEESMPLADSINGQGFPVALVQWRGCSGEDGEAVTFGVREQEDLRAILADVRARRPGLPIAMFGRSFGAGMSILATAGTEGIDALWLDGPFLDPFRS